MLERRALGELPPRPHTVYTPKGSKQPVTEYVFTRDGFSGGFSIQYLREAPTAVRSNAMAKGDFARLIGEPVPLGDVALSRRHIQSWKAPEGKDYLTSRTALYLTASGSCRASVLRGRLQSSDYAFSNGDADELHFVYEGSGTLLTPYGALAFARHDYVLIPRGIPYVFDMQGQGEIFLIEGDPAIEIPKDFKNPHGQLKLEAPFTHRDFRSPERLLTTVEADRFKRLITLRNNSMTEHVYTKSPADVIGWDGSVYPMAFNIHLYLPKTGKIHLPPNLHLTFQSPKFVVCSFVPRAVDYGEGAIPCPYPHSNVHCDEILYYVTGNFTSRKGIQERSVSHHPMGLPHGPQPGNYFKSVGAKTTDELAVMLDTWEPLLHTKAALATEDPSYAVSWVE